MKEVLKRAVKVLYELDELFRFHQLGFVALWPLLGLASVAGWSALTVAAVVAVAFFFNSFGVVLNDVVDLPVDVRASSRRRSVLVRGLVTPRQALAVALMQIPLMLTVHLVAGLSPGALPLLVAVTMSLAVYDLWSKTCRIPPLIDAALAFSGFFFVLYGARLAEHAIPPVAWLVAISAAVFLLYVNAFSNGLRDIENDMACGRHTTPIWLGCLGIVDGRVHISTRMCAYSGLLQALLIGLALLVLDQLTGLVIASMGVTLVLVASLANVILFVMQQNAVQQRWGILMRLHLLMLPLPLMLAFVTRLSASGTAILFSFYFGVVIVLAPLLTGLHADVSQPASSAELSSVV